MKSIYIFSLDRPDEPYSEIAISDGIPETEGYAMPFAVIESPMMDEVYADVLRIARWGFEQESGEPARGCSRSARVLCTDICNALFGLVRVPFTCRKSIDTEYANGADGAVRHGMKSATISYTPSSEPLHATPS